MANRKIMLPQYGTVMKRGVLYYRTRIKDANGKLVAIYAKTPEELYNKETLALEQIENATFHRKTPTVAEYCEKWLLMQSVHVRATTLTDYTSKVRRHIIAELGDKRMGEVSLDDIQLALVPVSKKSASVYKSVVILYKSIFRAAMESRIIDHNPTVYLTTKGGGVPQEDRQALTDEQAERLLDAIRDLPPYVFVMIGLYAGLRREEILALQWDSVYLDTDTPYLTVRRAWHTEHNRPVISDELKTKAAERNIPLPVCLAECLKAAKETSTSEYVVSNRDGEPLSYTQFKRLWQYIVTRTVKERSYYRYEDGKRVKHTVTPVLGEKAAHNGKVVYSLDFEVTPHQLRHTYITNRELDKIIPQIRQMGADYSDAWAMCFYYLYGQNVNADGAVKLLHVVEKISGYRKNVDPRVTNNKDVFIRAANDIASIVKKTILGKNESIVCPEGYFVGFGLFCVKYYVSHSVAIDIANHYLNTSDYRGYISQTFIKNVIQSIYHNNAKDATDCYTMWNHLNKVLKSISGNSVESSKQLIMALVTFVSALQITDDKEQQELVLILNSNMSNYLNSISIDFH